LAALVDKSLLHQQEAPSNEPRFIMLETIRWRTLVMLLGYIDHLR
jgi:hypothetical protein